MKYILVLISISLLSFSPQRTRNVIVKNTLAITRHEIVSVSTNMLTELKNGNSAGWSVKEKKAGEYILSQEIDLDGDSVSDELLFEVTLGPNEVKEFIIVQSDGKESNSNIRSTHSRLVP